MKRQGIAVYVMGPVPNYSQPLPRLLGVSLRDHDAGFVERHLDPEPRKFDREMASLARDHWGVGYISYFENLCTPDCPSYAAPGVPMDFDGHHLTAAGSVAFARTIRDHQQLRFLGQPHP